MDQIIFSGLRSEAYIGFEQEERSKKQLLEIDLIISLDLKKADVLGKDDSSSLSLQIVNSINYDFIKNDIQIMLDSRSWILLEELANYIADSLSSTYPEIKAIDLKIKKFIYKDVNFVAVRVLR